MKKYMIAINILLFSMIAHSMERIIYFSPPVLVYRVHIPVVPVALPIILGDHPEHNAAREFLAARKIFDMSHFNYAVSWIDDSNVRAWMSVANAFRHGSAGLAHELAIKIYNNIIYNTKLSKVLTRSSAAVGLSKIYDRASVEELSLFYARQALLLDPLNGFAWHRLGDLISDHQQRINAYSKALELAIIFDNSYLEAMAYVGIGRICEREKRSIEAQNYYERAQKAQDNYKPAGRALLRLKA
jgi:tetratricopeptide (TPR) repeat protein